VENDIFAEVETQSRRLGLPPNFYRRLLEEDDWSFVIKLNALVEAVCSDALAARLHEPALAALLATLDLGHPKHGKVALLRALGSLEKDQATVLQMLYELRNKLAHNVAHVAFSFNDHFESMDKRQRARFVAVAGHGVRDDVEGVSKESFVAQNSKVAIWLTVSEILACLHLEHQAAEVRLTLRALKILGRDVS
jgi:hypothetical protein